MVFQLAFEHPNGHELEKANRANIELNKGVEAEHLKPLYGDFITL
jgi:hypothetical protein